MYGFDAEGQVVQLQRGAGRQRTAGPNGLQQQRAQPRGEGGKAQRVGLLAQRLPAGAEMPHQVRGGVGAQPALVVQFGGQGFIGAADDIQQQRLRGAPPPLGQRALRGASGQRAQDQHQ